MGALVKQMPAEPRNRDYLREQWRVAALEFNAADDNASRLEEGRKLLLDDMTLRLMEGGESATKAEKIARTSEQFRTYLRKMHDARREANDLKIRAENANRLYWESVSVEATERAERRMSR